MALYALTIFLSAFLLFQVQPLVARFILPWFGGTPAVWNTSMLFFQCILLAGYAYAHLVVSRLSRRSQGMVHIALLGLALVLLAVAFPPWDAWKPTPDDNPIVKILLLLGITIGVPYLAVSANGPLLQDWFARAYPGVSPYRLYSLSNVGSLLALITYPFVFEPALTLQTQALLWKVSYAVFACCCGYCAYQLLKLPPEEGAQRKHVAADVPRPSIGDMALWLLLAAAGSAILLATTNQLCQDVAVVPFLWVLPLSLYLLTFIICFDNQDWYARGWFGAVLVMALFMGAGVLDAGVSLRDLSVDLSEFPLFQWMSASETFNKGKIEIDSLFLQVVVYCFTLFACCMTCHGELVQLKPASQHLTLFYLMISLGGAVGGMFVAIAAPLTFNGFYEYPICLLAVGVLFVLVLLRDFIRTFETKIAWWEWGLIVVLVLVTLGAGLGPGAVKLVESGLSDNDIAWYKKGSHPFRDLWQTDALRSEEAFETSFKTAEEAKLALERANEAAASAKQAATRNPENEVLAAKVVTAEERQLDAQDTFDRTIDATADARQDYQKALAGSFRRWWAPFVIGLAWVCVALRVGPALPLKQSLVAAALFVCLFGLVQALAASSHTFSFFRIAGNIIPDYFNWVWNSSDTWARVIRGTLLLTIASGSAWIVTEYKLILWRPTLVGAVAVITIAALSMLSVAMATFVVDTNGSAVSLTRNFYGVLRVTERGSGEDGQTTLVHGRITHGMQFHDPAKRAYHTSYYGSESGGGLSVLKHPNRQAIPPTQPRHPGRPRSDRPEHRRMRIGVVGLGTGTMASYAEEGDYFRFYDINDAVVELSMPKQEGGKRYFTYWQDAKDRGADVDVFLGDARLVMDQQIKDGQPQKFDVLVIDAFSSDAIPVHLLTKECCELYWKHLAEDGILAIHVSNRYIDLKPVVRALAKESGKTSIFIEGEGDDAHGVDPTSWVLVTSNKEFLANPAIQGATTDWDKVEPKRADVLWTDDFSSIWPLLQIE